MKVLAIDPSGNFVEGKGSTGWILAEVEYYRPTKFTILKKGTVSANDYETRYKYWWAVTELFREPVSHVIVEDYKLYNHKGAKAQMQSYSQLETPRLIGVLEYMLEGLRIPYTFQMATEVRMYTEDTLVYQGLLTRKNKRHLLRVAGLDVSCNEHERMAYKHFLRWFDKRYKV